MSSFDHWMKFHVGDYLADTMHLSTFQHGIYVLLIMHYFKRGELPEDEAALRRITKCPLRQWRSESGPVMSLFRRENESWRHPRIDASREEAQRLSEKRSNAGKLGARRKWGMASARTDDGNCHDGLAGARATPQPTTTDSPPTRPPRRSRHKGKGSRNGFTDIAADMIRDRSNAEADDARPSGARVVDLTRHLGGRKHHA